MRALTALRAILLALSTVTLVAGLATPGPVAAGAIKGTVVLKGTAPELKKLAVTIDQYVCGKEKNPEELLLSPQGGIRSAVVWLDKPPVAPSGEVLASTTSMDQKECMFDPRVVIVPTGGKVDFLNSDRLLHNLHAAPTANAPFNRTQPKGRTITISFSHPEIIRVTCDLHSWMRAWVVVAEHPFYALTNAAGEFALRGLPPGRYTLKVWQERLGTTSKDVVVGEPEPTAVTVEMPAR
jgi:plastocyanin